MDLKSHRIKIGISVIVVVAAIGASIFLLQEGDAQYNTYTGPPKALIIDQLYDDMPNKYFHEKATEYLEMGGYETDIVTTKDITVDFYKELPKMNYKYIVIRTHGAETIEDVVLFTGERYNEENYISEQLFGQVKKAAPLLEVAYQVIDDGGSSQWIIINETHKYLKTPAKRTATAKNEFFAISPLLVSQAMKGKFDDTVFLLGGCNTLSNPSLAKALIGRGASVVVGWDNTVGNYDNDRVLLETLRNTFEKNMEVNEAVNSIRLQYDNMAYPANFTVFNSEEL